MNLGFYPIERIGIPSGTDMPLQWHAGDELRGLAIDCGILPSSYGEGAPLHAVLEAARVRLTSRNPNEAVLRSNYLGFMDRLRTLAADDRLLPQDREVLQAGLEDVGRLRLLHMSPEVREELQAFHPVLNFWHRNLQESPSQRALTEFRAFRSLDKLGKRGQEVTDFLVAVKDESKTPRHMRGWGIHRVVAQLPRVPKYTMNDFFSQVIKAVGELDAPRQQFRLTRELAGTIDMTCGNARRLWLQCLELLLHVAEAHPGQRTLSEELLRTVETLLGLKQLRPWFDNLCEFTQYGKRFSKAGYQDVSLALRTATTLNLIVTHNPNTSAWKNTAVNHFKYTAVAMLVNPCKGPEVIKLFQALERLYDLLEGPSREHAQACMIGMLPWPVKSGAELGERWMSKLRGSRDNPGVDFRPIVFAEGDQLPNVLLRLLNSVRPEQLPRWLDKFIDIAKREQCRDRAFMAELARRLRIEGAPLSTDEWQRLSAIAGEALAPLRDHGDWLLSRKQSRPDEAQSIRTVLGREFEARLSALWRTTRRFDVSIKTALREVLGESFARDEVFERAWKVFDGKRLVRAEDFIRDFSTAMSDALADGSTGFRALGRLNP